MRQRVVEIVHLLRDQFELVGGQVLGDDAPFAVEDQPADGRHRLDAHAVALGFFGEQRVVDDLQLHQARDDDGDQQNRDHGGQDDPADEQASLRVVILDR